MKLLLTLFLIANSTIATPENENSSPIYLFKNFHSENEEFITLTGPLKNPFTKKIEHKALKKNLTWNDYDHYSKLGLSVFRTYAQFKRATSFLIGPNLILTNAHIISKDLMNNKNCNFLNIKLNHKEKTIYCKKIHYCSYQYDFCVLELKEHLNELSYFSLSSIPKNSYQDDLTVIGNYLNLGVQLSLSSRKIASGKNTSKFNMIHYAQVDSGSSGSPLINPEGEVIGIQHSKSKNRIQNFATRSDLILQKLKQHSPLVYNQLNIDYASKEMQKKEYWKNVALDYFSKNPLKELDLMKLKKWSLSITPFISNIAQKKIFKNHIQLKSYFNNIQNKNYFLSFVKCSHKEQLTLECIFSKNEIIKKVSEIIPELNKIQNLRISNLLFKEVSKKNSKKILEILFPR